MHKTLYMLFSNSVGREGAVRDAARVQRALEFGQFSGDANGVNFISAQGNALGKVQKEKQDERQRRHS